MAKIPCCFPARGGGKPFPFQHRIAQHQLADYCRKKCHTLINSKHSSGFTGRRGNAEFVEAGRNDVYVEVSWLFMSSLKRKVSNNFLNFA